MLFECVGGDGLTLTSSLVFVDPAGPEGFKDIGGSKDAPFINKSSLEFDKVIRDLARSRSPSYRGCLLTRFLQPFLSGNSKIAIIGCVTLSSKQTQATIKTLELLSEAKLVSLAIYDNNAPTHFLLLLFTFINSFIT